MGTAPTSGARVRTRHSQALPGALAETHALCGYDAVHLASAIAIADPALVVATWDRDLADAAVRAGYAVVPATV